MNFSANELQIIVNALQAAAPTGGGSDPFHLANKITKETGTKPDYRVVGQYQQVGFDEVTEYLDGLDK